MASDPEAQDTAERMRALMLAKDRGCATLGLEIEATGPGYARVRLVTTEAMMNFFGACHGGYVFALADTAFGFACNSHGRPSAGQQCQIVYLKPVGVGEELVAEARELNRTARSGLYDVTVRNRQGEAVAEFRGYSRTLGDSAAAAAMGSGGGDRP